MAKEDKALKAVEVEKAPAKVILKKAKVNMLLPGGTNLVIGQAVELSEEDAKHLKEKFLPEDLKHLIEE